MIVPIERRSDPRELWWISRPYVVDVGGEVVILVQDYYVVFIFVQYIYLTRYQS